MKINQGNSEGNNLPAGLSEPARRALARIGCCRLEQLAALTVAEVKRLHGVGPKVIEQLRRALAAEGLSFADEQTGQPKEE